MYAWERDWLKFGYVFKIGEKVEAWGECAGGLAAIGGGRRWHETDKDQQVAPMDWDSSVAQQV